MVHKKKQISDSEDDDIPLKQMKPDSSSEDLNSYDSLCVPSSEPCELCDQVSNNRYDSIIHNVKHIIIPLINQKTCQCVVCLHHFTSEQDLISHKAKKHSLFELVSEPNLVNDNFNNSDEETYENDLITIVKQETSQQTNTVNETYHNGDNDTYKPSGGSSLKSRLIFEDDDDDDIICTSDLILTDLTTKCQVYVDLFPPIVGPEETKSVHYDDLIRPGVFRCEKCAKSFASRYETIIHESKHIFIKDSQVNLCNLCNEYILGDYRKLKHHKLTSHHSAFDLKSYNVKDNMRRDFGGKIEEHGCPEEPYATKTVTMKLCDVCFAFCRNNSWLDYEYVRELSQVGKRFKCEKCYHNFFDINLVIRKTKYKPPCKPKTVGAKHVAKGLSNEVRLKNISNRFKMLKKIYIVVSFIESLPYLYLFMGLGLPTGGIRIATFFICLKQVYWAFKVQNIK